MTRITDRQLVSLADAITDAARKLELIDGTERFRIAGAYGGVRIECSFDLEGLERVYGPDRDAWPDDWSGVRTVIYGLDERYGTRRETYERGHAALGALHAVIDAQKARA